MEFMLPGFDGFYFWYWGYLFNIMDDTAIKLFRGILDSQVFAHPIALKIWIWCLCKATYKKRFLPLKIGKGYITVELLPGQFVFGRFKAEEELGIDGSTIYKWIQKFASDEYSMINIESNNQYSIITICKWEEYQVDKLKKVTTKEQPKNNSVTTEEQQRNTNNKVNNVNKEERAFNFYAEETKKAKEFTDQMSTAYIGLCNHICKKDSKGEWELPYVLKIEKQISLDNFSNLYKKANKNIDDIILKIDSIQNNKNYHNKYTSLYLTIYKWLNN